MDAQLPSKDDIGQFLEPGARGSLWKLGVRGGL